MTMKLFVFTLLLLNKAISGAQCNLGWCYQDGVGVVNDYKEAVRLFSLAAQQGHSDAQYNLGLCYQNGIGVVKDYKEAVRLFSLAAQQGDSGAQYNLGLLLSKWCWSCERLTKKLFIFSLLLLNKVIMMHSIILDCVITMVLEL